MTRHIGEDSMANLKNINFMTESRYKSLTETSENELYAVELSGLKPGTIVAFAGNSSLDGYLICNGSAVSRTTYVELLEQHTELVTAQRLLMFQI